jgi:hypothetical protein
MSYHNPSYISNNSRRFARRARPAANAESVALYKMANPELCAYLDANAEKAADRGFMFLRDMQAAIQQWGGLTEKQKAAVERCMERDAAHAARREAPVMEAAQPFVPRQVSEDHEQHSHAPHDPHLMINPDKAWNFMMAGKSKFTVVSKRTSARFTFRVKASKDGNVHFVHLLTGSDNERSFNYLGYIRNEAFIHGGAKAKIGLDAPGARAFTWTFENLKASKMPEVLEFWHEGTCGRCGRALTVPASIERGIGPECASRMGG